VAWSTGASNSGLVGGGDNFSASDGAGGDRAISAHWFGEKNITNGFICGALGDLSLNELSWSLIFQGDKIRFGIFESGSVGIRVETLLTYPNAAFYSILGTYDGSGTVAGLKLYINSDLVIDGSVPATYTDMSSGVYTAANTYGLFNVCRGNPSLLPSNTTSINDQCQFWAKELVLQDAIDLYNGSYGLNFRDLDGTENYYPTSSDAWYDFNTPTNFGRNYAEESHAVSLDGVSDSLFDSSFPFDVGDTVSDNPFSCGAWVKRTNASATIDGIFGTNNSFELWYDTSGGRYGGLSFALYDNASFDAFWVSADISNFPNDTWTHLIVTYDGTGGPDPRGGMKIYANGVLLSTTNKSQGSYTAAHPTGTFYIGRAANSLLQGTVDEAFFYSDELTSGEVSTLYNGGVVAPARTLHTDNLVSDWSFNAQNVTDIGKDSYGSNDLTPVSIVEADLVGGKDSLDLTEVSITSANAVLGHIEGKAAGYDGLTLVTGRSGGVNAIQATITEIGTWYTDNYMRFTGSDNLDTSANIDLSGDFTIICRCRQSNIAESCDLLSTSTTIWNNNTSGKDVVLGVTATEAHTQNKWQTISIKSDSGTISFRKSRLPNGSGTRNATVVTPTTMTISDITMAQNFDLRGLFVVERALPDSDIALVEEYFQTLDVETLEVELSEVGVEVILEQLGAVTFKELGVEIVFEEV
jgi:hypothetical protein